ncbi:hypothetical protein Vi05172_g8985 [Venturia inaequalis]|nr:hypothetical protein Vi05172_g8985 [Venturia inaequalis]
MLESVHGGTSKRMVKTPDMAEIVTYEIRPASRQEFRIVVSYKRRHHLIARRGEKCNLKSWE